MATFSDYITILLQSGILESKLKSYTSWPLPRVPTGWFINTGGAGRPVNDDSSAVPVSRDEDAR